MALQGVNLVFAFNGQEYLWAQVFAELGLTQHQIQSCFNGPAWLGWSRTYEAGWQNGAIFNRDGSFNASLHEDFLQGQHALQAKIASREIRAWHRSHSFWLFRQGPWAAETALPKLNYHREWCCRPSMGRCAGPAFLQNIRIVPD